MSDPDANPTAPNMRSFTLDSEEAYEALCPRQDRPWIMNGSLPREPRGRNLPVITEHRSKGSTRAPRPVLGLDPG